jgi:4-hydroxy-tetrahydrodipicolinate synthase
MSAIGRHVMKLSGYAPELPTPFGIDGRIDGYAFARLCDLQIAGGATALVVCGTTGEAPNLSASEHCELVRIAAGVSRGRVPVIAGAGSNATAHAIALSKDAEASGADAILSVVPYYNKPTQDGLFAHFHAIAGSISLPILLHDIPSRTVRGLTDETIARLAELPRIIGLKDSTGDVSRPVRLRSLLGTSFRLLCDDATALGFLAQGGDGCISVTSNIAPDLCRNMFLAWRQGHVARAQRLAMKIAELTTVLLGDTDPALLKYALSLLGLMSPKVRLPLVEPDHQTTSAIAGILARLCDENAEAIIGQIDGSCPAVRRAMAG